MSPFVIAVGRAEEMDKVNDDDGDDDDNDENDGDDDDGDGNADIAVNCQLS